MDYPFRGTCISLEDFENTYGLSFPDNINDTDIDTLVLFCEYVRNILDSETNGGLWESEVSLLFENISQVIEKIGYREFKTENGMIIYVPLSVPAMEVASIVSSPLSYKTLEYNHHSNKGNLSAKLAMLKMMADDIEPQRKKLKNINGALESNLFQMLQKFVRHNNSDNVYIADMTPQETEGAYDDIYQMWLLAKLELDNVERNQRVKELLGKING